MTEQPTPRTEAGRRLIGYLTPDALALVAEAEAQACTEAESVTREVQSQMDALSQAYLSQRDELAQALRRLDEYAWPRDPGPLIRWAAAVIRGG